LWRVLHRDWPIDAAIGWLLGFAPTVYLALSGGGYDIVARSEVGIVLWWIALLGAIVGVFPRRRWRGRAWIASGLLAGFFAWSWIAASWTASEEQTLAETARVGMYLGVLVLGLAMSTRRSARGLLLGLASGIALVSALAVLSKLVPSWFPTDTTARLYATPRLRYPFDYSDGVGEFAALGIPLLLFVGTGARSVWGRALGAGGLPVVVLCLAMTVSRGGILAAVVGVVFFFALAPDRLPRLLTALVAAVASAVELVALLHRPGLRDLLGVAPASQRHSMLVIAVIAAVVVGLIQAGITLALRRWERPKWLVIPRGASVGVGFALVCAVVVVVAIGISVGTAHHLLVEFKQTKPPKTGNTYSRLLSVAGSHRYQYWQVAIAAFNTSPWKGIGPGAFQFYWAQHQTLGEFVRNAHSLWVESLAETGIIGLVLIGGFFAYVLVGGASRAMRLSDEFRLPVATAVAGVAAFCAAAAFDWVWQIGVMAVIAMLLAAVVVGPMRRRPREPSDEEERSFNWRRINWTRIALGLGALAALWAILVPLSATVAVRSSQSAVAAGDFTKALKDAATAQRVEPGAASPRLQRALILEQVGDVSGASKAIAEAQAREPTNWQIWLVASRIATEAGKPKLALADYKRARSLNPTSPIFRR
jgi:hypothetical protein